MEIKKGQTIMVDANLQQQPSGALHKDVSERSELPADTFEFYHGSKRLDSEAVLASWGVEKDSLIEVKTRGRGGMHGGGGGEDGADGGGGVEGGRGGTDSCLRGVRGVDGVEGVDSGSSSGVGGGGAGGAGSGSGVGGADTGIGVAGGGVEGGGDAEGGGQVKKARATKTGRGRRISKESPPRCRKSTLRSSGSRTLRRRPSWSQKRTTRPLISWQSRLALREAESRCRPSGWR